MPSSNLIPGLNSFHSLGGYGQNSSNPLNLIGSVPGMNPGLGGSPSFMDPFLGHNGSMGWGQMGLGALGGIGSAFMGMKQYGLAKDALRQSRDQFNRNFSAQQKTLNSAMEDRQRARVASNPTAYESVGEHMDKHRI